jgi:Glycosyltransferase
MMKRVDILIPKHRFSQYGVLNYFTEDLHKALLLEGVDSNVIEWSNGKEKELIDTIHERSPDCTITFNGLPRLSQEVYLCDVVQIPHLAYLVDAPFFFFACCKSRFSIFSCIERYTIPFYRRMGFEDMIFMPHAIPDNLTYDPSGDRPYDVVMLASCIDYVERRAAWKKKFRPLVCDLIEGAINLCLTERTLSCYQAFNNTLDKWENSHGPVDPSTVDVPVILKEIEYYIRGKDRVDLIRSVKSAKVHIFGNEEGPRGWKEYVGDCPNVVIHDSVTFEGAMDVMKKSKIVLNSCPTIKDGVHERLLAALACGAVVISSDSGYIREQFQPTGAVAIYDTPQDKLVDKAVIDYLKDPQRRENSVEKGRTIVMEGHTWRHRVRQLQEILPPILEKRKNIRTKNEVEDENAKDRCADANEQPVSCFASRCGEGAFC